MARNPQGTRVIFDSSFLMAVVERPTTWTEDIIGEVGKFQPVLLDCVRHEIQRLAEAGGAKSRTAKTALDMASGFASEPCGGASVDDEIVSHALTARALVATTDAEMLRSLKAAHVRAVTLRGGRVSLA